MPFTLENQIQPKILTQIENHGIQLWFKKQVQDFCSKPNGVEELTNLFSSICTGIDSGYIEDKIKKAIATRNKCDILMVLLNTDILCGFMITEANGCNITGYKDVPVLSLICTSNAANKATLSPGRIMMYTYVTALKNENIKFGILELAYAYNNISGYCLYKKFGFDENMALRECYSHLQSLPMSVFVPNIAQEQLDTVLIHNKSFRIIDVLCDQKSKTDKIHSGNVKKEKEAALKLVQTNLKTYKPDELSVLQVKLEQHLSSIKSRYSSKRPTNNKMILYDVNASSGLNNMLTPTPEVVAKTNLNMKPKPKAPKSRPRSRSRSRSNAPGYIDLPHSIGNRHTRHNRPN
jgi:hypothetical protein